MKQDSRGALKRLFVALEEIKRKHKSLEKDIAQVKRESRFSKGSRQPLASPYPTLSRDRLVRGGLP
ncbi:MAG: hypothetical protein ACLP9K_10085 [Nitrososphaerales archaeon]|jgi:hypothetical protein